MALSFQLSDSLQRMRKDKLSPCLLCKSPSSKTFNLMPPSNAEATGAPVETIEITTQMSTNLSKALHAASFDFRSDTITAPTLEMLQSMVSTATFADDIYGRDPTTVLLETTIAKMSGFEDALFTLSGTQGNQICLRTHLTQPPHSILCDERTHVYALEAGGLALLSQAMTTLINPKNGKYITLEEIKPRILHEDVHFAPTRVISLENTINGVVFPYAEAKRISDYIRSEYKGAIKLHLDGARLWQGLIAEGVSLKQYCALFDSVSLCFSKGLSTPVGSVIIGSSAFIQKARHFKKCFGGGVRNPGILSAACLVALEETLPKLERTHAVAKEIARKATELGYKFTLPVDTNMVFLDLEALGVSKKTFQQYCAMEGVSVLESNRLAVHHQISQEGVARVIAALTTIMKDVKAGTIDSYSTQGAANGATGTSSSPTDRASKPCSRSVSAYSLQNRNESASISTSSAKEHV